MTGWTNLGCESGLSTLLQKTKCLTHLPTWQKELEKRMHWKQVPEKQARNGSPSWGKNKIWFRNNKCREWYNSNFSVRLSRQHRSLYENESKANSEAKCGARLPPEAASSIFRPTLCWGRIISYCKKLVSYNLYPTQNRPPLLMSDANKMKTFG